MQIEPPKDAQAGAKVTANGCVSCGRDLSTMCPACGGTAATPIVYGYPGVDLVRAEQEGRAILGGCVISEWDTTHVCMTCGIQWQHPMQIFNADQPDERVCSDPRCLATVDRWLEEWELE